jgi:hypothetical protein
MIRGRFIYFIRLILILASTRKLDDLAREHETTRRSGLRARENSMIWLVSTRKLDAKKQLIRQASNKFIFDLEFFRPMAITHEKTRGEKATYSTGVDFG